MSIPYGTVVKVNEKGQPFEGEYGTVVHRDDPGWPIWVFLWGADPEYTEPVFGFNPDELVVQ